MLRKILWFLVIILLLAGISLGAAYMFWYVELPRVKESRGVIKSDFTLDVDPINVPVIRNGSVERYMVFQVVLTFEKEQQMEDALLRINSIRDRFFEDLYQYTETITKNQRINKTILQLRLMRHAQEILGQANISRVIITGAFERG